MGVFCARRNNYASFQEIKTKTITVQASNNRGDSKKAKLFITLKKSPEFEENMKRFNEIRERTRGRQAPWLRNARERKHPSDYDCIYSGIKCRHPSPPANSVTARKRLRRKSER